MFIKEICTCSEKGMHFTQLIPLIENIQLDPDEFKAILLSSIQEAKEKKAAVLLNYCGHFDLLVTEHRIHVILVTKSFEHPEERR